MYKKLYGLVYLLLLGLSVFSVAVQAEQSDTVGDYVIHYNALNTEMIPPAVARSYKIVRSKNRGMLNIAVRKKGADETAPDSAVAATVDVNIINLNGQLKPVTIQEIREAESIYYIGVFPISNGEIFDFTLSVDPESLGNPHQIKFRQTFYTN